MMATCFRAKPDEVELSIKKTHQNHVPGSIEDVPFIRMSRSLRDHVKQLLDSNNNMNVRQIRTILQRQVAALPLSKRDAYISSDDIYNMYRQWRDSRSRKDPVGFVSVRLWLDHLLTQQFSVWVYKPLEVGQSYAFAFSSPWQKELLVTSKHLSVDATHHIGSNNNGILYTIVIRHKTGDRGVPVAYMFTDDQSSGPIIQWLTSLARIGLEPEKITIDRSLGEARAIKEVWDDDVAIQYCTWHVVRAWSTNLRTKVVGDSAQDKQRIISELFIAVREMMWVKDDDAFFAKWQAFEKNWKDTQPDFFKYFKEQWYNNDAYERWVSCFQPNAHTKMETNNYVESWHNQLKTVYLRRQRPRRLDTVIYLLVNEVEFDILCEIRRRSARVGRMTRDQHHMRAQEIKAEAIDSQLMHEMINIGDDDGNLFTVQSFEIEGVEYEVGIAIYIS